MQKPTVRHEHLFLIRIWPQIGPENTASGWRGSVQHVASGQRLYFATFQDLNDFISLKTGLSPPREGATNGPPPAP